MPKFDLFLLSVVNSPLEIPKSEILSFFVKIDKYLFESVTKNNKSFEEYIGISESVFDIVK